MRLPWFTNDIDAIVILTAAQVKNFCLLFPGPDYYLSEAAISDAVKRRSQFNVIHPASGLKIDVFISSDSDFDRSRFQRTVRLNIDDTHSAWFASPEDVILKKLLYFQEGGSDKHLRDSLGILKVKGAELDREYLNFWAEKLGVKIEWQLVLDREAESKS